MQKLSSVLLLAGILGCASAVAAPMPATPQSEQSRQTQSVNGTISSITDQGHSFNLDVTDGGKKQTLHFVLDKDAQVKGNVKVGTAVKVEYVAMADQNVATIITAEG